MSKAKFVVLITLTLFFIITGKATAQGLLGERYVLVEGGVSIVNDEWPHSWMKLDTYNPVFEIRANVPVLSHLDLFAGYAYGKLHYQYYDQYFGWGSEGNIELSSWGGGFVLHGQVHK